PELFLANEEANRSSKAVTRLIAAAIHNNERTQLGSLVFTCGVFARRRKQNRGDKHEKADNREQIAVPKAEREDDQRGTGNPEENAKGSPRSRIAPQVQQPGDDQDKGERSADESIAQAIAQVFGRFVD